MPDFLTALLWALTLLLSLAGWGRLAQRLAGSLNPTLADWLDTPTLGLATLAFLGGLLNLVHLATREMLLAVGIAGVIALLPDLNRRRQKTPDAEKSPPLPTPARLLLAVVLVLLTLRFISSIVLSAPDTPGVTLNPHDDMHSYLVSVARMLQTGSLGLDPFNDRLMVSGLGAQNFLNALGIAPLPFDSIHLADNGLGLVALTLSTAAFALRVGLPRTAAIALMLVPLAFQWIIANISGNVTSAATLLALASALLELSPRFRNLLPSALLLSATCALKSTMIAPAVGLVVLTAMLQLLTTRNLRPLKSLLLVLAMGALLVLPWMLWQYQSSGTLLYPLLGRGDHIVDSTLSMPLSDTAKTELLRNLPLPAACLLLVAGLSAFRSMRRKVPPVVISVTNAFLIGWLLQWPFLTWVTQYPDLWRAISSRSWSPQSAITLGFLWRVSKYLFIGGLLLTLAGTSPGWFDQYTRRMPHDLYASITYASRPWPEERAALADLQSAIPLHEPFLAYLTSPALLDFTRNPIYVIDWPGESSPPPPATGVPIDNPDALAAYLLNHHIRYIAYAYAAHANFYPQVYSQFLAPEYGPVIHRQVQESLTFQQTLAALTHSRKVIYNNSADLVIDLAP